MGDIDDQAKVRS